MKKRLTKKQTKEVEKQMQRVNLDGEEYAKRRDEKNTISRRNKNNQ